MVHSLSSVGSLEPKDSNGSTNPRGSGKLFQKREGVDLSTEASSAAETGKFGSAIRQRKPTSTSGSPSWSPRSRPEQQVPTTGNIDIRQHLDKRRLDSAIFSTAPKKKEGIRESDYVYLQKLYGLVFTVVCAFRGFFPRQDVEKYCLFDYKIISSVVLGRSLATIAEICLVWQFHLFLLELYRLFYPLIVLQDEKLTARLRRRARRRLAQKKDKDSQKHRAVVEEQEEETDIDSSETEERNDQNIVVTNLLEVTARKISEKSSDLVDIFGVHPRYWLTRIAEKVVRSMVPMIYLAECCSWIGVCTRVEIWNGLEESLWAFTFLGVAICFIDLALLKEEALRRHEKSKFLLQGAPR